MGLRRSVSSTIFTGSGGLGGLGMLPSSHHAPERLDFDVAQFPTERLENILDRNFLGKPLDAARVDTDSVCDLDRCLTAEEGDESGFLYEPLSGLGDTVDLLFAVGPCGLEVALGLA
jgi:hypothetical protein